MIEPALLLAALAFVAPGVPLEDRARYAEDIAAVVDDLETGLAIVATGEAESNFDPAIERCVCKPWQCDRGQAAGLFQLHPHWFDGHPREEICTDNRLSTALAAKGLAQLRRITGSWAAAFARYRGVTKAGDPSVLRRLRIFRRLLRDLGRAA